MNSSSSSTLVLAGCTQVSPQCPVEATQLSYRPNLGANAFFLALHVACALAQLALGFRYRTWTFMIVMVLGCVTEAIGYAGRLVLVHDPWSITGFEIEIILLIIAPVFFAAGIYLTLKHLVLEFGEKYSLVRPAKLYTWIFISADIISLIVQGVGGALAASGRSLVAAQIGTKIALAGITFQVISLMVFTLLFTLYFVRMYIGRNNTSDKILKGLTESKKFRSYFLAIMVAIITVSIRCIYRIPELGGSYRNRVFRSEIDFVVLDGIMISAAVLALTIAHPGYCFYGAPKTNTSMEKMRDEGETSNFSSASV